MSKAIKIMVITLSFVVILALSFGTGCALGAKTLPNSDLGLEIVEQAWNIIFQDYVDKDKLDTSTLTEGAIKGMVEALDDPYTSYLDAETYQLSLTSLEGKFEGIGAHVAVKDEQLMIIAPIADSPADRVGIRAGDIILEIDGMPTLEMSLVEAVLRIRGPKGTSVVLLVLHQGEAEPEVIEIVRAEIELPSVRFLDLRSNPGGALEAVVDVAGHFLKEGVVVNVVDNQGKRTGLSVKPGEITTDLPLVILVDSYSASGSEVLAGALQDYGRATIAGARTYGKGSVNVMRQLKDGSGLYITTARWLAPNGRLIEGEGLYPDYELELDGEDAIQWAIDYLKSSK